MKYDVTIIVPIYKVAQYIEKCSVSLFNQSYHNIEFVFVNDCTPDDSVEILERVLDIFPERKDHVKIINKPQNEGLGLARKTGVENASGECVLHVDSDDWIHHDAVSVLMEEFKKSHADIIFFDYYEVHSTKTLRINQNYYSVNTPEKHHEYINKALTGEIEICSIWSKLCKKSLYENIVFSNFSYAEDLFVHIQLLDKAKTHCYVAKPLYYYNRTNLNSITQKVSMSDKQIYELKSFYDGVQELVNTNKLSVNLSESLNVGILLRVIYISQGSYKKSIKVIAPGANKLKYIWKNKKLSFLKKIIYSTVFSGGAGVYKLARKFVNNR